MKFTKSTADLQEKSVKNLKTPLQKKMKKKKNISKITANFQKILH